MTVASLAARNNLRRQHVLVVLLALSLALNLCFIAGALWIRIHGPPPVSPEARSERIGAQLALDPQQKGRSSNIRRLCGRRCNRLARRSSR